MKVRSSIKKIDQDDQIVKRKGRLYVINKKNLEINSVKAEFILLLLVYGIFSLGF